MALDIICHGRLPWEEAEEEGEGDKFDDHRRRTGSTLFGNHAKYQLLLESETSGGTTAATKIATAEKRARRRRRKKRARLLSPNVYTFSAILACAVRDGNVNVLMRILRALEGGEEYPDVVLNHIIYSTVINACANYCAADVAAHGNHCDSIGNGTTRGIVNDDIVDTALEVLNYKIRTLGGGGAWAWWGTMLINHGTGRTVEDVRANAWGVDIAFVVLLLHLDNDNDDGSGDPPPSSFFESPPLPQSHHWGGGGLASSTTRNNQRYF
jgi:hypothetical protein